MNRRRILAGLALSVFGARFTQRKDHTGVNVAVGTAALRDGFIPAGISTWSPMSTQLLTWIDGLPEQALSPEPGLNTPPIRQFR